MTVRIIQGDCIDVLRTLPDQSVNCCVTSPPYWGLRDYGTAKWEGGDSACDHRSPTMREGRNEDRAKLAGSEATNAAQLLLAHRTGCGKCGAVKVDSQLGLESTPQEYVEKMVAVFREVRRVLRDDGTIWVNLGDSYASGGRATFRSGASENKGQDVQNDMSRPDTPPGLKAKDLCGIPWRVAFALQADGWYLRQDIIWAKPNPMPESVRDRCTKSHEYMFLLAKSEKYYCDMEAIAEPASPSSAARWDQNADAQVGSDRVPGKTNGVMRAVGGPRIHGNKPGRDDGGAACNKPDQFTRNKRSVWTVTTQPFKEAHFATFPPKLIEPCILAGCPEGGTVLDPFGGAGTTGLVADRFQRNAILIELNPEYSSMAEKRIHADAGMFAEVTA